ncbi:PopZ family protein [Methylobacterium sp. ID0610]|uniref:PopZ family protein n=1 Tax=Methylobacterium carpenticola TaxID=3344827 RepID=UPI0036862674
MPLPDPTPEEDVLDLAGVAEPLRKPPLEEDEPEIAFKDDPIDFDAIEIEPPPPPPPPKAAAPKTEPVPPPPEPAPAAERLISQDTDASVSQAFNLLAHTVLTNNARTLEDLVQDMLRPMLKAWLDDNLPAMVERLVRAEIERVARGR